MVGDTLTRQVPHATAQSCLSRPASSSLHRDKLICAQNARSRRPLQSTVGEDVGAVLGPIVGCVDGATVGDIDGEYVGDVVGSDADGLAVGLLDGEKVGDALGEAVGDVVGEVVGKLVGELVGSLSEGFDVGEVLGLEVSGHDWHNTGQLSLISRGTH